MKIKVSCIIHGKRRLSNDAHVVMESLKSNRKVELSIFRTKRMGEAIGAAREACIKDTNIVIAVGGDGTVNEVVNGIMQSGKKPLLALIPIGTGNDFQRTVGAFNVEAFLKSLYEMSYRMIDVCEVHLKNEKRYAVNICGFGFDGHVVHLLNKQRQSIGMGGKFSYAVSILRAFLSFKKPDVHVVSEEKSYQGKLLLAAVCNGRVYGHGLVINPLAELDNGKLSITLLGNVSLLDYVRNLSKLKKGELIDHPEVHYFHTNRLKLVSSNSPLYGQADGEEIEVDAAEFNVIPEAIKLLSV